MDTKIINQCTEGSFNGSMTFAETIKNLNQIDIRFYNVDLITMTKITYNTTNLFYIEKLESFDFSRVNQNFNPEKIKNSLLAIQKKEIHYKQFLRQIMEAGVCRYEVFIRGFKTIYIGFDGDLYVESFPQSFLE